MNTLDIARDPLSKSRELGIRVNDKELIIIEENIAHSE